MALRMILTAVASPEHRDVQDPSLDSASAPDSKGLSVGRRWRLRRNLVIYIASQQGVSQRMLADVFDLPHSRIAAIIKELRAHHGPDPRHLLD